MELIIAITFVGFVISLAGQLLSTLTKTFNIAERRWEVQTAVRLACTKFETNKDSIINAYKGDLIYDTALDAGVVYNTTTGQITWNQASKVMPTEGVKKADNIYTYIFSAPAVDQNGKALGSFLFIREFDAERSTLFLDNTGMEEVPVQINFRVASSPDTMNRDGSGNISVSPTQTYSYLKSTVEIDFTSGVEDITNFEVITQFALNNFNGRELTMENGMPVLEEAWLDNAYPAGWSADASVTGAPSGTAVQYITKREPLTYSGATNVKDCSTYMSGDANLMRFVSERAVASKGEVDELTSSTSMATCLTKYLFTDGTRNGARTIGALRDFRDNVLRGTVVGDWVIDQYYNNWSPALISACQGNSQLKAVLKAVISPAAKVLGLIAID